MYWVDFQHLYLYKANPRTASKTGQNRLYVKVPSGLEIFLRSIHNGHYNFHNVA